MSVQKRPNGTYYVHHRDYEGKKNWTKTMGKGPDAYAAAQELDALIKDKKRQLRNPTLVTSIQEVVYLDDLAGLYYKDRKAAGWKKWFDHWCQIMNRRILPKLAQIPVKHLTQDTLVGFILNEFPKASQTTHGNYLSYLKMMFNWGVQRGYIEKNPLAYWKRRVTPQKELTLTLEDINKIRAVAPPHTALGIEFVANTGVRPGPSELLALKWSNIQWEQSAVRVFAEKTQKWRTIPLKPEFLDKLRAEKELSNSDFIISFRDKQVSTIHHSFRLACRKVEVPDEVVLYDIRHWFCSTLLSQGVPVKTVSVLMGHASAKMTLDRYAHVIIGDADKAIAQLPSLG